MESIIIAKSPRNCDASELEIFEELVIEGSEVDPKGLRGRILDAEHLFFIYIREQCVGIGAIKHPRVKYKLDSFEKAEGCEPEKYECELGWVYVNEKMRGLHLGDNLIKSMCYYISDNLPGQGCFATVRKNNTRMHHLLEKYGFSKSGHSYKSGRGDYLLDLYVKE